MKLVALGVLWILSASANVVQRTDPASACATVGSAGRIVEERLPVFLGSTSVKAELDGQLPQAVGSVNMNTASFDQPLETKHIGDVRVRGLIPLPPFSSFYENERIDGAASAVNQ